MRFFASPCLHPLIEDGKIPVYAKADDNVHIII